MQVIQPAEGIIHWFDSVSSSEDDQAYEDIAALK